MAGSRRYEKMLMGPFYPGGKTLDNGDRDTTHKTVLKSVDPVQLKKIAPQAKAEKVEQEKKAWDKFFAGRGPMPGAKNL